MSFYSPIFPYVDETVRANPERAGNVNLECRDADPIHCHDGVDPTTGRRGIAANATIRVRFTRRAWLRPDPFGLETREPHEPPYILDVEPAEYPLSHNPYM